MSEPPPHPPVRLAHLSDTHVCYEAYPAGDGRGGNQRGRDFVTAFRRATDDICAWDPPLVVHAGDVFDRPMPSMRYLLAVRSLLATLAGRRPDGSRRQLVICAGNHEQPAEMTEPCVLELFADLPGVHVVAGSYEIVDLDDDAAAEQGASAELAGVSVHAVSHEEIGALARRQGWRDVAPLPGRTNVLTSHGVAGGSELYTRSLGREHPIPTDALHREWDYVALGHWHKRTMLTPRVWYCGSTEASGFRDVRDGDEPRGWLQVTVTPGGEPEVASRDLDVRALLRLPAVDATGLAADALTTALIERLRAHDLSGAVVNLRVTGLTRERWGLVDLAAVRRAAGDALHFQPDPRFDRPGAATDGDGDADADADGGVRGVGLAEARSTLERLAGELLDPSDHDRSLTLATGLLDAQLASGVPGEHAAGSGDTSEAEAAVETPAPDEAAAPGSDPDPDPGAQPAGPDQPPDAEVEVEGEVEGEVEVAPAGDAREEDAL